MWWNEITRVEAVKGWHLNSCKFSRPCIIVIRVLKCHIRFFPAATQAGLFYIYFIYLFLLFGARFIRLPWSFFLDFFSINYVWVRFNWSHWTHCLGLKMTVCPHFPLVTTSAVNLLETDTSGPSVCEYSVEHQRWINPHLKIFPNNCNVSCLSTNSFLKIKNAYNIYFTHDKALSAHLS